LLVDLAHLTPRRYAIIQAIDGIWSVTKSNDPAVAGQEHSDLVGP
jgi:hypothetical protein